MMFCISEVIERRPTAQTTDLSMEIKTIEVKEAQNEAKKEQNFISST